MSKILKILGYILIVIGIVLAIYLSIVKYNQYKAQDGWLQVETELVRTSEYIESGGGKHYYYGIYTITIDDKCIEYSSQEHYSSELDVPQNNVLLVKPDDHSQYHERMSPIQWIFWGVLGISPAFLGVILVGISDSKFEVNVIK